MVDRNSKRKTVGTDSEATASSRLVAQQEAPNAEKPVWTDPDQDKALMHNDADQSNRYFGSFGKDNTYDSNNHLHGNDSGHALHGRPLARFAAGEKDQPAAGWSEFQEVKHHKEKQEREVSWSKDEHKYEDGRGPKGATSNDGENWPWGGDGNHYFTVSIPESSSSPCSI